jgi:hypothetical protein
MISVVFNAAPALLIDDQPNWDAGFAVDATIPASYERGLSGRETRRPTADTLRLRCKFTAVLENPVAVTNLRNSIQALNVQPVLCPFWPAGFQPGITPPVTAAFYALFNSDGTFSSIQPAAALPFVLPAYPLMVGIFSTDPDPVMLDAGKVQVDFDFSDNGNYPLIPAAFAAPNGLNAAGGMRPLFPFIPDWSTTPHSGSSEQDVERRQIGNLRTLAAAYYAQRGRRKTQQFFTLQNSDAFNLLRFFSDMGGEQNNFWLGACLTEASLTANLGAAGMVMTVDNGAALGTNAFILLSDGVHRVPLVVDSVAGNIWNLDSAAGTAFTAGQTRIESLVLARFDALKLTVNFNSPIYATAQVSFKETPWETNAVAGEIYGTTMGALPMTGTFFKYTQTTPSGVTTWYFTGFERNLSDGVNVWLSAAMEYDTIIQTADLKRNSTAITSRNFPGNPLAQLFPLQLEWPLMVEIFEGDINGGANTVSNLRCYFYGECGTCQPEPPFLVVNCKTLSHIWDRKIPRRQYQRTDNWVLFETANGLTPADWQWNAVVVSYDASTSTLVVNTLVQQTPANALANATPIHWFAAGYLIITAGSGKQQVRMIGDNTAPAGGSMSVFLATALTTAPSAGDVVNLFPGYDGQAATAKNKFNNYQAKFGGFPFMPIGNPTVLRITQPSGTGKK